MALMKERYSIKVAATMLIGILLLSTLDTVHAQTQVTARGDEYRLYYGFVRYGILSSYPQSWTNDIVYDHNNDRIILTDHTLSDTSSRRTVQIYNTEGSLLHSIPVNLNIRSSVEYDHVNNRIIVGGVSNIDQNNKLRSWVSIYDGSNYNLLAEYPAPGIDLHRDRIIDVAYDTELGKILVAGYRYEQIGSQYTIRLYISMIDDAGNFVPIRDFDDCVGNGDALDSRDVKPIGLIYDSKNNRIFVFCNFEDNQNNDIGRIYVMRYDGEQDTYVVTAGPFDVETNMAAEGIGLAYDKNRDRLIVAGLGIDRTIGLFDARSDTIDTQNPLSTITVRQFSGMSSSISPAFAVSSKITYDNNHDRIIAADVGRVNSNDYREVIDIFGRSNSTIELLENNESSDGSLAKVGDPITVRFKTENTMYDGVYISMYVNLSADVQNDQNLQNDIKNICRSYNPLSEGYGCSISSGTFGGVTTVTAYITKSSQLTDDNAIPKVKEITFKPHLPGEWNVRAIASANDDKIQSILDNMELGGYVQRDEWIEGLRFRVLTGTLIYKSSQDSGSDQSQPTIVLNRTINIGESVTVKVMTIDENVKQVKFTWIRPDNSIAREQTVQSQDITTPITGKGAEDTFTPDQVGDGWKVRIELQDEQGNTLYEDEVTFNVIGPTGPTYILELSSDNTPVVDNGSRDLGSSITASIRTDVGTVNNVVFRWLYIQDSQEQTIREQGVQVSDGRASDTFTPDQVGAWKVIAVFRNDENTLHTIERRFTINPVNNISVGDNQGNSINLNTTQGDNLISLPVIEQPNPDQMPQIPNATAVNIPYGLLSFKANTSDEWLTIDIQYPSPLPTLNDNQYYAYLKRINDEWKIMNMDPSNQDGYFELVSNTTIRLHIKDNGQFDADDRAGIIADPGGIAILNSYNYGAGLIEDGDPLDPNSQPSDGVISLGEDITARAVTDNLNITSVRFKWIDPTNNIVRDYEGQLIYLNEGDTTILVSFDTFTPDKTGIWTVATEFSDGTIVLKTLDVSFQVVPESIIGALAVIGSSLAVLALYRRKRAVNNSNKEG